MNRVARLLALAGAGIGLAASVVIGAAPAQAAGVSGSHRATAQAKANWYDDRTILVLEVIRGEGNAYRDEARCYSDGYDLYYEYKGELEVDCLPILNDPRGEYDVLLLAVGEYCDLGCYPHGRPPAVVTVGRISAFVDRYGRVVKFDNTTVGDGTSYF